MINVFVLSPQQLHVLGIEPDLLSRHCIVRAGSATFASIVAAWASQTIHLSFSPILLIFVVLGIPLFVWTSTIARLRDMATRLQRDMDLSVAVFLDLINVLLAGGAGIETAMLAAAGAGDGWGFEQLRMAMARAQSSRRSYWDSLRETGEAFGIESLEEVANSVQLAGEHGARIRQSLTAKAASLRIRNLARIEHEAEQRTERMGIPVVLLFIGFILLVGYPAFAGTISAL